jgi:hypothetical protein
VTRGGRQYKRRRPLGLAPWKPQPVSLPIIEAIDGVLDEYRDQWPLTVRQIMYRLIGLGFKLPKKKKAAADCVGDKLNRGRRSGRWPWETIRDEGAVHEIVGAGYDDPAHFWRSVRRSAKWYERDLHAQQPRRLIVWCEAAGMVPSLKMHVTACRYTSARVAA